MTDKKVKILLISAITAIGLFWFIMLFGPFIAAAIVGIVAAFSL